jgi:iron complex transport system substrate-binding protein
MPASEHNSARMQRIVSLAPNVTSILLALGVGRELVGVSKWCRQVASVSRRPHVGDCWKVDVDQLMRLKPTLLIGSVPFANQTVAHILEQPVAFLAINPRTLADIENDIRTLGRVVNRTPQAETLIRKMRRGFIKVGNRAARICHRPRPRVYCEAWPHPRISSPRWVAEITELAGGNMIVRPGTRVTDEEVARANPDVIVLAWTAAGDRSKPGQALSNPLWRNVPAVKTGRVVVIRDELLNTPGPPLVKGAQELFRIFHSGPDSAGRGR